ncbi:hypothetical protein AAG906_032349 [Vitis piasezkii]
MFDQSEAIGEERLSLEISVAREVGTMRSPWVNKKFLGFCKSMGLGKGGALSNSRKDRELKKLFSSMNYEGNIGKEKWNKEVVSIVSARKDSAFEFINYWDSVERLGPFYSHLAILEETSWRQSQGLFG